MTSVEVIEELRDKLNKNSINDNTSFDPPRLIPAINEAQIKYVNWVLENKKEDDIILIQKLKVDDLKLNKSSKVSDDSNYFEIPKNYFHPINLKVYASDKTCNNIKLRKVWQVKGENIHELFEDEFNKPSMYWGETFYTIGSDSYRIFRKDFTIEKVKLDYYRHPKKIDIEGYIDVNGKDTITQNPELDDRAMHKIIDIAVKDLNINSENLNRLQADITRINTEN